MTRRDEQQPDGADLGSAVQLDPAETLTGSLDADPLDVGYVPPDRPYGLDDAAGSAGARETLDERLRRERPEQEDGVDAGIDGGAASVEEAAVHDADLGVEPVVDDGPVEDPEVRAAVETDPRAAAAEADARRDQEHVTDGP